MSWQPGRRLLTVPEAAASVGRPASTIRRWLAEGRLTSCATWAGGALVLESELLEVDAQTTRPRPRPKPGIRHAHRVA